LPICINRSAFQGLAPQRKPAMSSLAPVATESTISTSVSTPSARYRRETEALAALAQLERDLQRLGRALLPPAPSRRFRRRVRWLRTSRAFGGYPAL